MGKVGRVLAVLLLALVLPGARATAGAAPAVDAVRNAPRWTGSWETAP